MNQKPGRRIYSGLIFILCVVIGGLLFACAGARAASFSSRLWQMEDGLPHNIVQAITQTQDGYLWVGTREGLARFDGNQFLRVGLTAEITRPSVLSLHEGRDGALWIGTENAGLYTLKGSAITRWYPPAGSTNFAAYDIYEAADGAIWVASSVGVLKCSAGKVERVADFKNLVQSLCVDADGSIWLADDGLKCLTGDKPVKIVQGSLPREPRKIYCDQTGVFWIAAGDGLTELKDGVAKFYHKADGPSGFVSAILRDKQGELWTGTYSGISRFIGGKFVDEVDTDESSYRIYSIFEDREGTLWFGSEEGLRRLTPRLFKTFTRKQGLTLNTVVTVCASRDGSIWVGAWGGGLNHLVGDQVTALRKTNGLSSDFVMAMHEGHDGSLWVGTDYGGALNRIKNGEIIQYDRKQNYAADAATAIFEDDQNAVWVGSRNGLLCMRDGNFTRYSTNSGLNHNKINALCGGNGGSVWIGTDGGLDCWKENKFVNFAAQEPQLQTKVLCLYEDKGHTLWIGTKDRGLLRRMAGKVDAYTSSQGLFSDSIYSILEDDENNLWLNSSRGIFRIAKKQFAAPGDAASARITCVNYGKMDGILSSGQYKEVTQPTACKSVDGRLWFRTTQGVAVVDPREIVTNGPPPAVLIEEVLADKASLGLSSFRSGTSLGTTKETHGDHILTIEPGRGELEIQYAALSFRAPEKNQFKYQLDGSDMNWVEAGTRHAAYYNNLRPGEYHFRVIGCNSDGVWNETGASLTLRLLPHFWQTWWFFALCATLVVATVGGTVRYATWNKMQRKLAVLEQQNAIERERSRIAEDIHDDLGARLTKISMLTEQAEREAQSGSNAAGHLRNIYGTAQEMLTQLDETVWAVNPRNDQLDQLADYIMHYAEEFFRHTDIRYRLKIPGDIPPLPILAEPRHHIFLAVKEALNNAAKHSGATEVQVHSYFSESVFTVQVRDNGRGFEVEKCVAKGHGLQNMQSRVKSLGGQFDLQTKPGGGTTISLAFNVGSPQISIAGRSHESKY